jgi:Kef-type K+ transport system membrane component KefB
MSTVWFLMGLLLLSYLGSFLVEGHAIRGFGLASSAEYVVLGFVLGQVLGLVDRPTIELFDPLTGTAVGWIALVIGLDYGFVGGKRIGLSTAVAGSLLAAGTGLVIAAALWVLLGRFSPRPALDRVLIAGGIGVACSETTRHAVRWVVERHGASGPLSRLVAELSDADDLPTIVATAALFSLQAPAGLSVALPAWGWAALPLGLGALLGGLTTLLLGREFRLYESWGMLLGTSFIGIGLSSRLGLSPLTTMFTMGATISALSRHRAEIYAMTAPTERAVLLPTLLLAGARLDLQASPILPAILAVTIGARLVSKVAGGLALRATLAPARPAPASLGLGLVSTGGLAMCIGLAFALRFPGAVGAVVLVAAAAVTVFGEFVGPASLRSVLRQVGEIAPPAPPPSGPQPPAAPPTGPQEEPSP